MQCRYCGKDINGGKGQLSSHEKYCNYNPNRLNVKKQYIFICKKCGKEYILELTDREYKNKKYRKYCSRSCANSRTMTDDVKLKIATSISKTIKANPEKFRGGPRKVYRCKECGKEFTSNKQINVKNRSYCSLDCKTKYLSKKIGGYRKGSGRGKSGWYKGIHCDSSWELAFVIYHIDNGLNIARCKEHHKYIFKDKEHIYIPDFVTDNGIIEIKGYKTPQWEAKEKSNLDIKVLYKDDMKFYLDYVITKYGKDYIKLYEKSPL